MKGFLITSSVPGFFSAGIDLSLFVGEMKPWLHFWKSLRNMFLRIYTSKLVSIACIQGLCTSTNVPCCYLNSFCNQGMPLAAALSFPWPVIIDSC